MTMLELFEQFLGDQSSHVRRVCDALRVTGPLMTPRCTLWSMTRDGVFVREVPEIVTRDCEIVTKGHYDLDESKKRTAASYAAELGVPLASEVPVPVTADALPRS